MADRSELHERFCEIINMIEPNGDRHVYFNPPESIKMNYPAIVYKRKPSRNLYANNGLYKSFEAYEGTVIDRDPDSEIFKKIERLPYCTIDRYFVNDNLNHAAFTIFY